MDFFKALPYVAGILGVLGAGIKWLYGKIEEDRNYYERKSEKKQKEIEKLKDKLNRKEIEIIKLKASQKDAFFDRKDKNEHQRLD